MTFKITRPDAHGLFLRKRLFRTLDAERRRPVIWVSGPPGCGKTALVSSWLEARRIPCLWYQVEMGDSDLGAFFHYLDLAVFKARSRASWGSGSRQIRAPTATLLRNSPQGAMRQ